jgi:hypothetical protein
MWITSLNSHFPLRKLSTKYDEPNLLKARYQNSTLWIKDGFMN